MTQVEIWTDGGCRGNPGPGGWAALLIAGKHEKTISGAQHETTNNRMELTAAIRALESLKRPCVVQLYTDSEYLRRGISEWLPDWEKRHWKTAARKPVKNADLWRELDALNRRHRVTWHWVPAHSGIPNNERVDKRVNAAIDALLRHPHPNPLPEGEGTQRAKVTPFARGSKGPQAAFDKSTKAR